ncbi:MAG TPA: hypothetical protein VK465_15580 [Fibrobacteria bacterium]|nr:hypothetical protein [Fibrobacteria bacterium]
MSDQKPNTPEGAQEGKAVTKEPTLREMGYELLSYTNKLERECAARLARRENADLTRAKDFLHEAGQWLEKAVRNLKAAGV